MEPFLLPEVPGPSMLPCVCSMDPEEGGMANPGMPDSPLMPPFTAVCCCSAAAAAACAAAAAAAIACGWIIP